MHNLEKDGMDKTWMDGCDRSHDEQRVFKKNDCMNRWTDQSNRIIEF